MYKWEIANKFKVKSSKSKVHDQDIVKIILDSRGIKTKIQIEEFLNPKLKDVNLTSLGIKKKDAEKSVKRIFSAIKNKEQIVVFGDYDADGICGTAILWETLRDLGANAMPYLPHRIKEGYGLSKVAIKNLRTKIPNVSLIITVDNGIVANEPVEFAKKSGIDVIITDHHVPSKKLPKAYSIFHSTKVCGTAVAWMLSQELKSSKDKNSNINHLDLVCLATISDLMPLTKENRTLVKFGLKALQTTNRVGLLELFKEAQIDQAKIGVYEIGHIIAPRLNATGRLGDAMDSLRLVCTTNPKRAHDLARMLGSTNKERQDVTNDLVLHAKNSVGEVSSKKLIFIYNEIYQPGVIGLIAGKLVEEFYRPAIVLHKGEVESKASARSISGFNIIEFIRLAEEFMVDAGGHPMAAGFTVETAKLKSLQEKLERLADSMLSDKHFVRKLKIDMEIPLSLVSEKLYSVLQQLSPFGMANPEPVFLSRKVKIRNARIIGTGRNHLKLAVSSQKSDVAFNAIAFNFADKVPNLKIGDKVDIVYTIDENQWNGNKTLQLKIKDLN